ncbi:MAG: thioredoxin fold domain-containing protein [Burkholderiaceae bacterium]|jgi:thioredoxin-related protein|nr:thioredoxin fold domain-containing protein [Burkholderiaceae bacterium]
MKTARSIATKLSKRMPIRAALLSLALLSAAPIAADAAGRNGLERPASHEAVLREAARERTVVVALFSLPGCPFCEAIRRDQLRHLAREQATQRVRVVEYDLTDRRPFSGPAARTPAPDSPAALAASLDVRLAPTVAFIGPDGKEIAERLVGYSSPDFYGAYLEQRIAQAHERLGAR